MTSSEPDPDPSSSFAAFLDWFTLRGGRYHDALEFRDDSKTGPGLFTTRALPAPTNLVDVPVDLCLTPWRCKSQVRALLSNGLDNGAKQQEPRVEAGDWVVCVVALARMLLDMRRDEGGAETGSHPDEEKQQEGDGQRAAKRQRTSPPASDPISHLPYVALMPSSIVTPMHMRRAELELLQSTPLFHHGLKCRYRARRSAYAFARWIRSCRAERGEEEGFHSWLVSRLPTEEVISRFRAMDEAEGIRQELETWDEADDQWTQAWRWAETSYTSRSFPPRLILGDPAPSESSKGEALLASLGLDATEDAALLSGPILIPGLDFFNHKRGQAVEWGVHPIRLSSVSPGKTTPAIYLLCPSALSEEEQAWNNYGAKSNEEFLGSYGFVLEEGEDDAVTLVFGGSVVGGDGDVAGGVSGSVAGGRGKFFWRRSHASSSAPPGLVEAVESLLLSSGGQDEGDEAAPVSKDSLSAQDKLDLRLEALSVLEGMLKDKKRKMKSSRPRAPDEGGDDEKANEGESEDGVVRESVRRTIEVYRAGQESILKKALKWCGTEIHRVEEELQRCEAE